MQQLPAEQLNQLTCRVELHKLHVLIRQTGTVGHGRPVTCAGVGRGAGEEGTPVASANHTKVPS